MSTNSLLLALAVLFPLLLAAVGALVARPLRLLPFGALPGLACAWLVPAGVALEVPDTLLGAALRLDALGAIFLGLCAFLWTCAGIYAQGYLAGKPHARSFCVFWQLTLAGSLGTCLAADVVSFYVAFALVSLPAYVLVIHARDAASLRAGRIYLALALFGEMALLLGLMLGTQAANSVGVDEVRQALPAARWGDWALLGLLAGLGLKCGLVPLHGWLPLAHSAAPVPASAVLSGAIVKAGVIGLLRFVPAEGALPLWPDVLTWVGLGTAYAGVLLGLAQREPKPVLAYSTMSQMGLVVAVLGAGFATPGQAGATYIAVVLLAVNHGLAKGALFLGVGLLGAGGPRARWALLALLALLGAAIAGLPLSGGAVAKLATKAPLGKGVAAALAAASALGTMLLMLRLLTLAHRQAFDAGPRRAPAATVAMVAMFGGVALAALVAPWLLAASVSAGSVSGALDPAGWWAPAWPIAAALLLAGAVLRRPMPVPGLPVGDIASWAESGWARRRAGRPAPARPRPPSSAIARRWIALIRRAERASARLASWPTGAASLALLALLLGLSLA